MNFKAKQSNKLLIKETSSSPLQHFNNNVDSRVPMIDIKEEMITFEEEMQTATMQSPQPPRKRQRLDHLSNEEKMMRRKLKNRVAAQTARDRKKIQMDTLEEQVRDLQMKVLKLEDENIYLRSRNMQLETANRDLEKKLRETDKRKEEEDRQRVDAIRQSIEYAEEARLDGGVQSLDDALRWLSDVEPEEMLDILQEFGKELLDSSSCDDDKNGEEDRASDLESKIAQAISTETVDPSEMVGTNSEQLESIKELIHFDHVYHKNEPVEEGQVLNEELFDTFISQSKKDDCVVDREEEEPVIIVNGDSMDVTEESVSSTEEEEEKEEIIEIIEIDKNEGCDNNFNVLSIESRFANHPFPVTTDSKREENQETCSDSDYESSGSLFSPSGEEDRFSPEMMDFTFDRSLVELFPSLM